MPARSERKPTTRPSTLYPWMQAARNLRRRRPGRATPPEARPPAERPRPAAAPTPAPKPAPKPTAKPAPKSGAIKYVSCPPGFWFTGVIHQKTGVYANVSDRFVKVGGTVNEAKVLRITQTSVEMERNGERFFVSYGTKPPPPPEEDDEYVDEDEDSDDEHVDEDEDRPVRKKRRRKPKKPEAESDGTGDSD